jgi:hypothetical protein
LKVRGGGGGRFVRIDSPKTILGKDTTAVKKPYHIVSREAQTASATMQEFAKANGQILLPLVGLITQAQDGFDCLPPNAVDHLVDSHSGLRDQFHQWQKNLPVGSRKLLHCGRGGLRLAAHDMVRFLHGGGVLSKDCFWRIDSSEPAATAASNLQLNQGVRWSN